MVEPKSVKLVTEVQFFQSPPYYYGYIETEYTHNNVANQKKFKKYLDFSIWLD